MLRMFLNNEQVAELYDNEKALARALIRAGKADRADNVPGHPVRRRELPEYIPPKSELERLVNTDIQNAVNNITPEKTIIRTVMEAGPEPEILPANTGLEKLEVLTMPLEELIPDKAETPVKKQNFFTKLFSRKGKTE